MFVKMLNIVGNCDMTFLTFAIAKFNTLKFRICSNEIEILQSTFESTESQQSTLQTKAKYYTNQIS
jgi:hypothetical protein